MLLKELIFLYFIRYFQQAVDQAVGQAVDILKPQYEEMALAAAAKTNEEVAKMKEEVYELGHDQTILTSLHSVDSSKREFYLIFGFCLIN